METRDVYVFGIWFWVTDTVFRIVFNNMLTTDNMGSVVSYGLEPIFKMNILPKGKVGVGDNRRWGGWGKVMEDNVTADFEGTARAVIV